jgi:hypothetical protein
VGCHFGCEKNNRDKREQIYKKVDKVRDEVEVIPKDYFIDGRLGLEKVVDLLRQVENNYNDDKKANGVKKCTQEFADDIIIDLLHFISWFSTLFRSSFL